MAETCVSLGCPEYIRLSKQDRCTGKPIVGAGNGALISCQRNTTVEARVQDATTSTFETDCGVPIEYTIPASVIGYDVSFEVTNQSPSLQNLLTGAVMLTVGADNVGVIEQSGAGCTGTVAQKPVFIAEVFYRVAECTSGGTATYKRRIITGVEFTTPTDDAEGQLRFVRYNGVGKGSLAKALTADNAGPFNDIPADIESDITALAATFRTPGLWFYDTLTDPAAGLALVAGTCYMVAVPPTE